MYTLWRKLILKILIRPTDIKPQIKLKTKQNKTTKSHKKTLYTSWESLPVACEVTISTYIRNYYYHLSVSCHPEAIFYSVHVDQYRWLLITGLLAPYLEPCITPRSTDGRRWECAQNIEDPLCKYMHVSLCYVPYLAWWRYENIYSCDGRRVNGNS